MPVCKQPDFDMHYEIFGHGPESIVFIHGNIASTRWWDKYLAHLPPHSRAIAMDLRGCGRSGRPCAGYTIGQFAADVEFLIRQLAVPKFHLIGHSMGGQLALYYALKHSEAVQTLTLLDSVPAAGLALDDAARAGFDLLMKDKAMLQQAVEACMPYCSDNDFVLQAAEDAFHCAPNVFKDNPETMHSTILIGEASSISAPTLIIHGREDAIIPLSTMQSTFEAMPHAKIEILEECGHSPQVERPLVFSELFNSFINQYPILKGGSQ